jgi:hypothetical protein
MTGLWWWNYAMTGLWWNYAVTGVWWWSYVVRGVWWRGRARRGARDDGVSLEAVIARSVFCDVVIPIPIYATKAAPDL